ncbi:hypothetical protein BDQ17DRAFT_1257412 [Cyathus striatus]|nr:hypothetical protein BDQ17DRAFT_1257412 [Cyathus striatus]
MITHLDREERGVGSQNFCYAPPWMEFCQILRDISPQAYQSLAGHIPKPEIRTLQAKRAREVQFPMTICSETFDFVQEQLQLLGYCGPTALSCDDTKLLPAFRLCWSKKDQTHYLVGGKDGPLRVANPDEVRSVLEAARSMKATKVRLWCLTLPLPKVSPIIVAAIPISDRMLANELFPMLQTILDGLIDKGICIVSYAADGSETE